MGKNPFSYAASTRAGVISAELIYSWLHRMDNAHARTYEVRVGDRPYMVTITGHSIEINGNPLDCALENLHDSTFVLHVGDRKIPIVLEPGQEGTSEVTVEGHRVEVQVLDALEVLRRRYADTEASGPLHDDVRAPMPGLVLDVLVAEGQAVTAGQGLLVLEAMKMENEICSERAGVIRVVHVKPSSAVRKGDILIEIDAEPGEI